MSLTGLEFRSTVSSCFISRTSPSLITCHAAAMLLPCCCHAVMRVYSRTILRCAGPDLCSQFPHHMVFSRLALWSRSGGFASHEIIDPPLQGYLTGGPRPSGELVLNLNAKQNMHRKPNQTISSRTRFMVSR